MENFFSCRNMDIAYASVGYVGLGGIDGGSPTLRITFTHMVAWGVWVSDGLYHAMKDNMVFAFRTYVYSEKSELEIHWSQWSCS